MAYPIVRIDPDTAGRERSPALWRNVLEKYDADRSLGVLRSDDFRQPVPVTAVDALTVNGWWTSDCGLAGADTELHSTVGSHPDGHFTLSAATATDFEGTKMQAGQSATVGEGVVLPTATTNPKSTVVFEWRGELLATKNSTLFIGLAEQVAVTGLLTAAANAITATCDLVGFYRLDDGNLLFVVQEGTGAVVYSVPIVLAADVPNTADLQTKLGFRVNNDSTVEVFVNGARIRKTTAGATLAVTTTALPLGPLSRTIAAAAGDDGITPSVIVSDYCDVYVAE